jgi:tripartite ATP-independent transporter DctM subunit
MEMIGFGMFALLLLLLLSGYPVAFALAGTALIYTVLFSDMLPAWGLSLPWDPVFRTTRLNVLPQRIYGSIMNNYTLVAVPFFIFMGALLERTRLAEDLLQSMGMLFGRVRGGLAVSVVVVGTLLAATTGVVGASVVAMAIIALPVMLRAGYDRGLAGGTVAASGTLGQIIPPSIVLIILGDQMGANVGDLFLGALLPGMLLSGLFIVYILVVAWARPAVAPALPPLDPRPTTLAMIGLLAGSMLPPLLLIAAVLGTIFAGIATPTEAGAMGALGALLLGLVKRQLSWRALSDAASITVRLTTMVFVILLAATVFATVFSATGGTRMIEGLLSQLPGGAAGFLVFVMLIVFVLGFFLDFIEITFIVVPLIVPVAALLGIDPVWLGVLLAINLQTSFLTPPFGFALFYLRGAAPPELRTIDIYRGIVPFIAIQLLTLAIVISFPALVTWLPGLAAN